MSFRLRAIAKFEIAYRLRLWSTWLYAALLTGVPLLMLQAFADNPRPLNSPIVTALAIAGVSLIGMLVTAAIFGEAATRDIATETHPLFFTMPVSKLEYLGGRFLGAFAVNAVLLLFVPLGLLLGTVMPYEETPTFGPFVAAAYIQPLLAIALPNLVFTSAILFTVAQRSRQPIAGYLAAIALFFGYIISGEFTTGLANRPFGLLLDPFALNVIQFTIGDLAPAAQQTALLGFSGIVLANRALWLGVGVLTLVWLYRRFRFDLAAGRQRARHPERSEGFAVVGGTELQMLRSAQHDTRPSHYTRSFGARTAWRQVATIANRAFVDILTSRVFQVFLAGAVVIVFAVGWDVGTVIFDTSTWPLTHLVASVMRGPAAPAIIVLIAVYAGELVWKERDARVAEIADTEPTPTWVSYAGKFIALVGMLAVFQAVNMVAGILLQAVRGYYRFELAVYVQFLFGFLLVTYILIAALAMVVHVLVNHKALGHVIVTVFFLAIIITPARFGLDHRLVAYGRDPGWVYSDMNGFGPFVWPFIWLKLYWAAWALLLGIVAVLFYVRGTESGLRHRLAQARRRFTAGTLRAFGFAALLILTLGGWVFYNTNVMNEYRSEDDVTAAVADYERAFRKYQDAPQPVIVGARMRVEIHPARGAVDLAGTYRMVNKTRTSIDSVHVMALRSVDVRSLSFDRPATLVLETRPRQQWRTYKLERPLRPGDSLSLTFDHRYEQRGFPNSGVPTAVAKNGAYFDRRWLPMIGYQESFELSDEGERKKQGLPVRPTRTASDTAALRTRSNNPDADRVDMDIVIGTAGDQVAVTTGTLVRDWRENGRRYFHYKTEEPLTFELVPFLSAQYAVSEDRWRGPSASSGQVVTLKIFHHPTHDFNIERMFRSMKGSLEYFTTHFGPFQFSELRIVEFPRYASFARAHPQTIAFGEGSAFLTRIEEDDMDRTFFVVAHETSHQWWGHQVAGARVEGAPLLSETLAMYSSMMVMETTYGREQVDKFYRFEMDLYHRGRANAARREVPLLRVGNQSHLYYHKGAVAMYTLKEHIGEERVNAALRTFLNKWRDAGPPYPTSHDLYKELRAVTPDSMKYILTDLFETITLWNVGVSAADAERVGPGEYRVTLEVQGRKLRADSTGRETETPMNDFIEIGVYSGNDTDTPLGPPLYLKRHRIPSGRETITLTVKGQPGRIGVDPRHTLIQRSKEGKVVALETMPPVRGGDSTAWRGAYRAPKGESERMKIKAPSGL